jgi:hypothetical protein
MNVPVTTVRGGNDLEAFLPLLPPGEGWDEGLKIKKNH